MHCFQSTIKSAWRVVQYHSCMTNITQHNPWKVSVVLNEVWEMMHSSHILRFIYSLLLVLQVILKNHHQRIHFEEIIKKRCALYKLMLYNQNWYWLHTAIKEWINSDQDQINVLCWANKRQRASVWEDEDNHNQNRLCLTQIDFTWTLGYQDDMWPLKCMHSLLYSSKNSSIKNLIWVSYSTMYQF